MRRCSAACAPRAIAAAGRRAAAPCPRPQVKTRSTPPPRRRRPARRAGRPRSAPARACRRARRSRRPGVPAQDRQRRPHRGRVGVVALVEQSGLTPPAARSGGARRGRRTRADRPASRQPRATSRAQRLGRGEHRQAVQDQMLARRAERDTGMRRPPTNGRDVAMPSPSGASVEAPVRLGMAAEGDDPPARRAARPAARSRSIVLVVAVHDRDAARSRPSKISRLGVGDRLDRGEVLEMGRRDGGDDRHVRAHLRSRAPGSRPHGSCRSRTRRSWRPRGMRARLSGTPQ